MSDQLGEVTYPLIAVLFHFTSHTDTSIRTWHTHQQTYFTECFSWWSYAIRLKAQNTDILPHKCCLSSSGLLASGKKVLLTCQSRVDSLNTVKSSSPDSIITESRRFLLSYDRRVNHYKLVSPCVCPFVLILFDDDHSASSGERLAIDSLGMNA